MGPQWGQVNPAWSIQCYAAEPNCLDDFFALRRVMWVDLRGQVVGVGRRRSPLNKNSMERSMESQSDA